MPMTSPHEAVVLLAKNGLLDHADLARPPLGVTSSVSVLRATVSRQTLGVDEKIKAARRPNGEGRPVR